MISVDDWCLEEAGAHYYAPLHPTTPRSARPQSLNNRSDIAQSLNHSSLNRSIMAQSLNNRPVIAQSSLNGSTYLEHMYGGPNLYAMPHYAPLRPTTPQYTPLTYLEHMYGSPNLSILSIKPMALKRALNVGSSGAIRHHSEKSFTIGEGVSLWRLSIVDCLIAK